MKYDCNCFVDDLESDITYRRLIKLPFVPFIGLKIACISLEEDGEALTVKEIEWDYEINQFNIWFEESFDWIDIGDGLHPAWFDEESGVHPAYNYES